MSDFSRMMEIAMAADQPAAEKALGMDEPDQVQVAPEAMPAPPPPAEKPAKR